MVGHLVLVAGPSGAGKDSLIDAAKLHFAGDDMVLFPRRVVTRQATPTAEDHESLSTEAFASAEQQGAFFLHWHAHGLSYGLPASAELALHDGCLVIANVSRTILAQAAKRWPNTTVLLITASPDVLAIRVAARGRSEDGDVKKRISRSVEPLPSALQCVEIRNEGTLTKASAEFCSALSQIRQHLSDTDKGPAQAD
ncbi:MAG TPA: phosphonate metabolism protein/1,5-bisphosphokinase (PRPP-forming) PhnN [Aestuariivirga sp.]